MQVLAAETGSAAGLNEMCAQESWGGGGDMGHFVSSVCSGVRTTLEIWEAWRIT